MGEEIVLGIMRAAMVTVEQEFYKETKKEILRQTMESLRRHLLGAVFTEFSREVAYNAAQYVRALGSSSLEISVEGNAGEVLEQRFKKSVKNLEDWIENQPPSSPVVKRLLEIYGTSDRSSAAYVKMRPQAIWQTLPNTAPRSEPWLNRTSKGIDISDMINEHATKIFNQTFSDGPLSTNTIAN
jgi:hypothetical protein